MARQSAHQLGQQDPTTWPNLHAELADAQQGGSELSDTDQEDIRQMKLVRKRPRQIFSVLHVRFFYRRLNRDQTHQKAAES